MLSVILYIFQQFMNINKILKIFRRYDAGITMG